MVASSSAAQSFGLDSEAVIWIDRSAALPEGLPARQRRAGRVRRLDQHGFGARACPATDGCWSASAPGPTDFTGYIVILPPLGDAQ